MKGKFFRENRYLLKPLLTIFLIYLVGISAIILAGVHYADDAARTNYGYAGWSAFSRYLSTFFSAGLHADTYISNIAPLPQILAAGILAVSSLILISVVSGKEIFKEKFSRWILRVIAVVPLGLCPYMLECLSYQYDSVYMGLSVFFAVMPLLFYKKSKWLYGLMLVVGVLGVCMTYQASIGILPMLVIFVAMKDWSEKKPDKLKIKEIWKFLIFSAVVFVLALLVFQKFLMRPNDTYVSNDVVGVSEFFPLLFQHLRHYFELLFSDFKAFWLILMAIMGVGFVLVFVIQSKRKKIWALIVGVVGLFVTSLMTYVFYAALDKPLYTTRAMYAVGALISIVGVYIVPGDIFEKYIKKHIGKKKVEIKMPARIDRMVLAIPVILLSWCFFSFAFTYGNALNEQNIYRSRVVNMVISDVNEILPTLDVESVYIRVTGQIDFAPAVQHMPKNKFALIGRLLKPSFESGVHWMAYYLTEASGIPELKFDPYLDLKSKNLPILKETALYNIYGSAEGILVKFKGVDFSEVVNE